MPVIDMHAHLTPQRYKEAIRTEGEWFGLDAGAGVSVSSAGPEPLISNEEEYADHGHEEDHDQDANASRLAKSGRAGA